MMPDLFLQRLEEARQAHAGSPDSTRNSENQSYLEQQFHKLEHHARGLVDLLIALHQESPFTTKIFQCLLADLPKYATCLLSYCPSILRVLESMLHISVTHQHNTSQSVLLAVYLRHKDPSSEVQLILPDKSIKGISHMLVDDKELDKFSKLKSLLSQQKITVTDILEWEPMKITEDTLLIDIFNLSPVEYAPFLLRTLPTIAKAKRVILYHSNLQEEEIMNLKIDYFSICIASQHPLEVIIEQADEPLESKFITFLKEEINHPEKQDLIVFYSVTFSKKKVISKLHETISKNLIKDHVSLISKPNEHLEPNKNHIFLVTGTAELEKWNYDYSNVLYVVDYGLETGEIYDYTTGCLVNSVSYCSAVEKARRMAFVGVNRIGRYSCKSAETCPQLHYLDSAKELNSYCLKMIDYQLAHHLETHPRITQSLALLEKHKIISGKTIIDQEILKSTKAGIDPLHAKIIYTCLRQVNLSDEDRNKQANLLLMSLCILSANGNLRQFKEGANIKPSGIWKKSDYLDSSLGIISKCQIIETRDRSGSEAPTRSEVMHRKTSMAAEQGNQLFGCLFDEQKPGMIKPFNEMSIPDLIRESTVNSQLLLHIREDVDNYRQIFGINQCNINLTPEDTFNNLKNILSVQQESVSLYSGARRVGYLINGSKEGILPHKASLLAQLNEKPQLLFLCRLSVNLEGITEIMMSNTITEDLYVEVFKGLPFRKNESLSEIELEFHGISNYTFEYLWKNNGSVMLKFQNQHSCFVEPNQEVSMILIHCKKDNSKQIKNAFEGMLQKLRDKLSVSSKTIPYMGNTSVVLGSGGAVKELMKKDYIDRCMINNLHCVVTKEDLEELFEDFFILKDIQVLDVEPGKYSKSAIIVFNSQKDYFHFHECFNECMYFDKLMDVQPLHRAPVKGPQKRQYIEFKWYVWKSHCKAIVKYKEQASAIKACQEFKNNPQLDGKKVKFELSQDKHVLTIEDLSPRTDEIIIYKAMKGYGWIDEIEILKTPLKERGNDLIFLEAHIKSCFENPLPPNAYKMESVEKRKDGLRVCRVSFVDVQNMNVIVEGLKIDIKQMGKGILHAQTWFESPVLVPRGLMALYQDLLSQTIAEAPNKPNIGSYIEDQGNKKLYIILKGRLQATVDYIHEHFLSRLRGYPIELNGIQKSIILTDIGLSNLLDLEDKYGCKLLLANNKENLSVLTKLQYLPKIKNDIKIRIEQSLFYRISLNTKAFKHFKENSQKLIDIAKEFIMKEVSLEVESKSLVLEGSAQQVQNALNYLMHLIESLSTPAEEMINADVCLICCEPPSRPYRLQSCGHKFCMECVMSSINSILGDMTMFPLKCPHCRLQLVIDDLELVLDEPQWQKVMYMAINKYAGAHTDNIQFCFTPGCKQINLVQTDFISCDLCNHSYCLLCKNNYHRGMTCEQAKNGGDALFKKYMAENGIRECPNKSCKIPLVRIDGCYRVTCSRCNKSMCFKCEANKMIAYDDYNECYKHLNDVHGGYW